MGKVEGAWKHNARNLANIIITTAANITTELKRGRDIEKLREKIEEKLERITKNAKELMDVQMPPLSSEEGVESVRINQLIRDRVERLGKVRYTGVVFSLVLKLDEKATVRASSEWLRRAIDILIDNGVNAVSSLPEQIITIQTSWNNGGVEILVIDNGTGIPAEILPTLLKEPVLKKQGEKGSGLGLLQAQTILRTYGGRLEIRNSSSSGVAMAIWLPVER
jgi:C4-dicarboxylate-specific signal transduction histidine kinase